MALYIVRKDEPWGVAHIWYVGQDGPKDTIDVSDVTELQADSDELEYIKNMYPSLSAQRKRVVRWYGDIARTIFLNL